MHALTEDECRLLWAKREVLVSNPKALPKFLLTVNWGNHDDVREGYRLLKTWAPMPPLEALQLLSVRFPDPKVRSYAVRCMNALPDAELAAVMLQLAQVVKFERSHDTALNRFLLRRALRNPSVCGHALYWSLATEKDVNDEHHCCRVLFDLYNRRCGEYRLTLGHQALLVTKLAQITETVKKMKGSSDRDRDDVLRRELEGVVLPRAFQLPLSPFMVCRGLDLAKCKVMGSAQKPLWLTFHNAVRAAPPHVVIFKCGDDLRQDQLTLQIIRSMDALWTEAGLELRMSPYGCVATAGAQGFIEVVQQANTLANITKDERFRAKGAKPRTRASRKYGAAHEAYYGTGAVAAWLARECAAYASEKRVEAESAAARAGRRGLDHGQSFRHAGLTPRATTMSTEDVGAVAAARPPGRAAGAGAAVRDPSKAESDARRSRRPTASCLRALPIACVRGCNVTACSTPLPTEVSPRLSRRPRPTPGAPRAFASRERVLAGRRCSSGPSP